ncbi:uncharacterized protein rab11fip5a isoform X1 [Syngnathus typhle]|uniref:uncharacterized protein rab11fip5a isoform X1 n=2 Tax=Syngnathus typhle TaxID=161592 RepID=UPI002A69C858|nr:uncharacterized protein rab11fip5a isoform X1 [Syngnathus typhle]
MEQPWVPTHVQVTVLRGRGLRGKGKHGTSDVYAVIQLAKEKYLTCVAEKTTEPEWREECCFELQPGVLDMDTGPELVLTVMHRAVIGLDVFLGQAIIQLRKIFHESRGVKNQWYRLNSKTGKKEKERGDIQVSVQFTRNNLTASMYDLVMKDKGASTFSKLKERMRGKRRSSEDEATSGGTGPLSHVRQRLPSDGGGEEEYEDDEGGEVRRSKMRTFFLRGKLRKSSDTRSSTSLGSESSESSSRGGSLSPTAGISVVVSDLSNSPSNSSNLTADSPDRTADTSPRLSPLRCDFSDEINEITIAVPQLPAGINGTHKPQDQASGALETSLGLGHLQKTLPLSVSLQNLHPRASAEPLHGTVGDGRRWSFDKAGEEESAAIAAAMEKNCPVLGREETGEEVEQDSGTEGKHKGWFGSKESHSKSSSVAPHELDPSTEPPLDPLHQSNPFCSSPPLSPSNPFLSHDTLYDSSLLPLPFLSNSRPPIEQLFPKTGYADTQTWESQTTEDHVIGLGKKIPLSQKSSNPFALAEEQEPHTEWDDSFEEFAACRLQGPKNLTSNILTNTHQLELGSDERNDSLNTKSVMLSNYMTTCSHLHSLDPIPEDESFEHCNEVFNTLESHPPTGWHQANSTTNMAPFPDGSSGIGSSVEDDFLFCFSSNSASDKFSACSLNETEPQNFESVAPNMEILSKTVITPKGSTSTDELLTDAAQQTASQSDDSEWWDSDGSLVFTPPPTMSSAMIAGLEATDMQTPENLDLEPKCEMQSDDENNEEVSQGKLSGQPSQDIPSSPPGTGLSLSFEEGCWESPVPSRHFGDSDKNTNSFLQSLNMNTDSQDNQNCCSLPPSDSSGISNPTEKSHSENLTFYGELGQIGGPAIASVSPDGSNNQADLLAPIPEIRSETGEQDFSAVDKSFQVLPATDVFSNPMEGNEFPALDVGFARNPPQLSKISQNTRSFLQSLNSNLQCHQNQYGIYDPSETLDSEKSTFSGESGEISEFIDVSFCGKGSTEDPNNQHDLLSLVMTDSPDTFEPCFTAVDDNSSQFLPVTHTDSYQKLIEGDQVTDLSAVSLKRPLPPLPQMSQITRGSPKIPERNLQDHQNHISVPDATESVDSEKSTFCGELEEIPEPIRILVSPRGSTSGPNDQADSLFLMSENTPDTCESGFIESCDLGFTARNDGSSEVLPGTPSDSYPNTIDDEQFTVVNDVFVNKPSPEVSQTSQSTRSFLQSLDGKLQHHYGIATQPEMVIAKNSTFCGELGEIQSATTASLIPENFPSDSKNLNDWLSVVTEDRQDPYESSFNEGNDGSSQVLPASSTDSYAKPFGDDLVTAFDDMFVKNPPPQLPKIFQRTMSVPSFYLSPNHYGDSKPTKRRGSENSTFAGKAGEVPEDTGASLGLTTGPNINTHITDWLTQVMTDRADAGFTQGDLRGSQVLAATPTILKPDEVFGNQMVENPPPHHPTVHRASTLPFNWDKTLPLSFWNESCSPEALSTSPSSPCPSTASAPTLTRQNSCFPSFLSSPSDASLLPATLNPQEALECQQEHATRQELSPHPVRPLSSGPLLEGRSVLEKIKSSIHPGRRNQTGEKILTEGAGSYYHLTHSELIGLLVQREAELDQQKAEFQQQRALLAKREVELRKLKPQVRDLEDYIDTLLVRIMEQKPTLLQVRSRLK